MNEAEYLMKNYGERGGCYLHMKRKPNSIIVLLFIQNNSQFKNISKTSLPAPILSLFSIVYVQVCPAKYSPNSICRPLSCLVAVFLCFQPLFRIVPAIVLTLETSEEAAILVFTTKTTQSRPQVFSVNGALTCRRLHF